MNPALKDFIRLELRSYKLNKECLQTLEYNKTVSYRQLLFITNIVTGIDSALACLPEYICKYAQTKYFNKNHLTNFGLALKFDVTERTIFYWDKILLVTIAKHIGALSSTDNIS